MANVSSLALLGGWVEWWQIALLIVLAVLIVFWMMYRRRQM